MDNPKSKSKIPLRLTIQIFFLLLIFFVKWGKEIGISFFNDISLHAICPFGGVESIFTYVTSGTLIRQVQNSAVVLMFAVFGLSLLFGPVFCGWMCPLGTVQELLGKIGRKLLGKQYNAMIPGKADKMLRFLRYSVMALVIYNTAVTARLIFQAYDPYFALFNMFTNEVAITAYLVLGVVLFSSLITERPFCKYACPYGALLGMFNLIRVFRVSRKPESCVLCKLCDKRCPMNIAVSSHSAIRNHQCISCLECTSENACPKPDTVNLELVFKKNENSIKEEKTA